MYTPYDILDYIEENELESAFLSRLAINRNNYSIGEIVDREFRTGGGTVRLASKSYTLDIPIKDEEIVNAIHNKMYVSAFISRYNDEYEIHFLVHQYPEAMKKQFDEMILKEVIQYMILKTIIKLRLDTPEKIDAYVK